MTIPHAMQMALQYQQAGRLHEAEALYRQILAAQPNHVEALHSLGLIAHRIGSYEHAVEWIGRAITLSPNNPATHNDLGAALAGQGKFDQAAIAYRQAIELAPDYAEARNNLGLALRAQNHLDEAIAACQRALEIKPAYPQALNNLGGALRERGQFAEAVDACRCALKYKPDYPEALINLAAALAGDRRFDEAIASYRRALELRPDDPHGLNNLGAALADQGRFDEASAAHRRALELKPDFPEARYNLGNAFRDGGRFDEAIAAYRQALELRPDFPAAHNNLGTALAACGRIDEAIATYRSALQIKPDFADAFNNLGNALKDRGELDEAIAAFREALSLRPKDSRFHSNLVYTLHFHPGYDDGKIAEERRRWNRQFGEPLKQDVVPHANDRRAERRLRVGYVSPDFRDHVVGRYMLPLLECHDFQRFEVLCYSGVLRPDKTTEEFRGRAQHWRSTVGVSDDALAEMIQRDGVDILVDLTQHMAGNRLSLFARQPAPVQVSLAGYPETTGLDAIKYRISDRYLDDPDKRAGRNEEVCLIDSFWCYDPRDGEVEVNSPPAMKSGAVTFGCLNNFCKINERVMSLWAQVLGKVKDSRLVISSPVGSHRRRTLEAFERMGVAAGRLEFVEFLPFRKYLELYHRVDIVLDTFPYNGGMTTCDALWMGAPVVSLAGDTAVSRAGLSQLSNLGLPEWVAHSEVEYVSIAERLSADFPHLARMRSDLRSRLKNSVLMDAPHFTRQVEQAYREMWKAWRRGESSTRENQ